MSRTLFLYIFKDLFKIFVMASCALAGIMSFGGLLRPLTREGLDAGQVTRMLFFFGPAMTTYSFPVAALFATAVVYGRLAADNELTACKAGGISLLSLTVSGPALVLGLIVAIVSLLFLCFIVPFSTLQVEKVIYSNLARLVQSRIERNHEIEFEQTTIFAQEAHVLPPQPDTPAGGQLVEMIAPAIIKIEYDKDDKTLLVPKEFYTASRAWLTIVPQRNGEEVEVIVNLYEASKFPRRSEGATEVGVGKMQYGPFFIPSPIKEDVKFMSVSELKTLYADLSKSRKLKPIIEEFVRNGQRKSFSDDLLAELRGPAHQASFNINDMKYTMKVMPNGYIDKKDADVRVMSLAEMARLAALKKSDTTKPAALSNTKPREGAILFTAEKAGHPAFELWAESVIVQAEPASKDGDAQVHVSLTLKDCWKWDAPKGAWQFFLFFMKDYYRLTESAQSFNVPMSAKAQAMAGQSIEFYETHSNFAVKVMARSAIPLCGNRIAYSPPEDFASTDLRQRLTHDKTALVNAIIAESNGRASFAISCLILVMAGSALGMMFRSGNFLTAFAVSFVPALLSITLIVAGQRTAANVPLHLTAANNPLKLGLTLIWTGNAVNFVLAIGLLWKLGRR